MVSAIPANTKDVIYVGSLTNPELHETGRAVVQFSIARDGKVAKRNASAKDWVSGDDIDAAREAAHRLKTGKPKSTSWTGGTEKVPVVLQGADSDKRLDDLKAQLRPAIRDDIDRAAFTVALIDTFWSPEIQETARAIADKFGKLPRKDYIDIGAVQRATNLLAEHGGELRLVAEVPELGRIHGFTDHLRMLKDFFDRGMNGLADHGPFTVNGRVYNQVFRLPFLPQYPPPQAGLPPEARLPLLYQTLESTINEYELRFKDTGYDRVYVLGQDDRLYVAVRDDGIIRHLNRGDKGTFALKSLDAPVSMGPVTDAAGTSLLRNTGAPGNVGEVLRVVDVPNNVKEAAVTYWRNLGLRTVRGLQKGGNETTPLIVPTGPIIAPGGPAGFVGGSAGAPSGGGVWDWVKNIGWITSIGGLGMLSSTYFTGQGIGAFAALSGGVTAVGFGAVVGGYLFEKKLTPRNALPFFSAAGLSSNRELLRADLV